MREKLGEADYFTFRKLLDDREISCKEATQYFLDKIDEGKDLNAFISVFAEKALERAEETDKKIANDEAGTLAGLVIAVKDLICVKGEKVTCGSKILENFVAPYDATVTEKLKEADAIIIGKTNMDEFAMGSSNENSYFGVAKNPHDPERIPGGSSGGSAVAVAAGMATAALGSDTGGSIRQPAAMCGIIGLKPTYGRVSRYGLVAFASSLDQIGPITRSTKDCALLMNVISGYDCKDSTSVPVDAPDFTKNLGKEVKGIKVGLPKEYFAEGLDLEIRKSIEDILTLLEENGAVIEESSLPTTDYAIAAYYIIAPAEASSNLARYDGTRYGFRCNDKSDLDEMYTHSRSQGFGNEVKRRIMLGTYVLSAGYYEAYYLKAQKVRTLIRRDFERAFEKYDCLITPTSPTTAFKLGEKIDDPLKMYLSDIYTISANLAGIPAISIPCGVDSKGLPIGLQILGKPFDEATILQVASFVEEEVKAQAED